MANEKLSNTEIDVIRYHYIEASNTFRYFLDWRHRVLARFGIVNGSVLVFSRFVVAGEDFSYGNEAALIALSVVIVVGVFSYIFDSRNAKTINQAAKFGAELEKMAFSKGAFVELHDQINPYFVRYTDTRSDALTYQKTLATLYLGTAFLAAGAFVYIATYFPLTA